MQATENAYPVQVEAQYPEASSRVLALLGALLFLKVILLLPHTVVLYFLQLVQGVVIYLGYWVVLFTGRYPRGMYEFVLGVMRWTVRVNAWLYGLSDRYPPFSLR